MSQSSAAVHSGYSALFSPALRATSITSIMAVFIGSLDTLIIGAALPTISQRLHGAELYAVALGAYLVASLMGMPLFGAMSDQTGPWRAFLIAASIFAAGALVGGFAPSMPALVFARATQGFGAGGLFAVGYAAIGRQVPTSLQPHGFGLLSATWGASSILGPAVGAVFVATVGWRWVFWFNLPLILVILPAARAAYSGIGANAKCEQLDQCSGSTATWPHRRCCDRRPQCARDMATAPAGAHCLRAHAVRSRRAVIETSGHWRSPASLEPRRRCGHHVMLERHRRGHDSELPATVYPGRPRRTSDRRRRSPGARLSGLDGRLNARRSADASRHSLAGRSGSRQLRRRSRRIAAIDLASGRPRLVLHGLYDCRLWNRPAYSKSVHHRFKPDGSRLRRHSHRRRAGAARARERARAGIAGLVFRLSVPHHLFDLLSSADPTAAIQSGGLTPYLNGALVACWLTAIAFMAVSALVILRLPGVHVHEATLAEITV